MKLRCNILYYNQEERYVAGQVFDTDTDAHGDWLQRDSPGSFSPVKESTSNPVTETATGVKAPDRKARGGRKRGKH